MSAAPAPPLRYRNLLKLWKAGKEAFDRTPGFARPYFWGIVLTYVFFVLLALLSVYLTSLFVFDPAAHILEAWLEGRNEALATGLGFLGTLLLWLVQTLLLAAGVFLALLVTLALMGPFVEAMIERLVLHCRGLKEGPPMRFGEVLGGMLHSLGSALRGLGLSLLALLLNLLPLFGWGLAAAINAYLLGRDVREPYLSVRRSLKDPVMPLDMNTRLWTMSVGLPLLACGLLPVLGWVLLPWLLVRLAVGFAWDCENQA